MNKTRLLKFLLPLPFVLLAAFAVAQVKNPQLDNPKYGDTPEIREKCLKNTSFYTEYYKQDNFKDAAMGWSVVYQICPRSSENIFIRGIRMIKKAISDATDEKQKTLLVDSLMNIYRKRITYFRKEGYNLSSMGVDLYMYQPQRASEARDLLIQALALEKEKLSSQATLVYMQTTLDLFTLKKLVADTVISDYNKLSDVMSKQIATDPNDEKLKSLSETLDNMFTTAGVADCNSLIEIYSAKLETNPNDADLARSIYTQLAALRCTESELYLKAATVLFDSKPNAALGNEIARLYVAKHMNSEAEKYFKSSIAAETDSVARASMLVEYASFVATQMGDVSRARSVANEALRFNPRSGLAYFLIGSIYGGTKNCGANKIDHASVLWAAVDKFNQAKSVDPALASDCNKQIAYYSQFFPTSEEIFFQDLEEGKVYTVPCWINEKTTIRARQ